MADDSQTGDKKMAAAKILFQTAMAGCQEVSQKMSEWADKFDDLRARPDWGKVAQQIYLENKDVIDRNLSLEFEAWKEGVYFNSGMFAGSVEYVFLSQSHNQE